MTRLAQLRANVAEQPWELWTRQVAAVLRMDLRKNFLSRRGIWIYLLAFAPVAIITLHVIFTFGHSEAMFRGAGDLMRGDTEILAGIFQFFYLRLGIFFGCLGIFTWLFRGEIIEKSLHYYFLAPMRRELLVLGKFIAGAITAIFFFGLGVFSSFTLMYVHLGPAGRAFLFDGPG